MSHATSMMPRLSWTVVMFITCDVGLLALETIELGDKAFNGYSEVSLTSLVSQSG